MADNVSLPASSGTVAADEVADGTLGTVKVQFVKLMDGTLDGTAKATVGSAGLKVDASGAAVPVTDNAGSITVDSPGLPTALGQSAMANSLRVVIASDQSAVPINPIGTGTAWNVNHQPAAATQATASKASAGAGVKNVCMGLSIWVVTLGTAPTAANLVLNLRDGATGAGSVIWSWTVRIPATTNQTLTPITVTGLWIVGSAATAMTLESSAAPGTNVQCGVNMNGTTT